MARLIVVRSLRGRRGAFEPGDEYAECPKDEAEALVAARVARWEEVVESAESEERVERAVDRRKIKSRKVSE